ncbi:MAG: SDR family oxidoreductase [Armatimonadetes bacterium]|nr:SDR family oxidoreductase [Armatimonadota bacterium]
MQEQPILVTGATGYVGGRLVRRLEAAGRPVRCLARRAEYLRGRVGEGTTVFAGDVLQPDSLTDALTGVRAAYYLVHAMAAGGSFEERDRRAAANFGAAARAAGLKRIIYLGGLGGADEDLSAHLRSRREVGDILRASGVPVTEFRASIVIGSGSLSFELIRALVERLPVMVTPRWVSVLAQPIAIEDLLAYLLIELDQTGDADRLYEIGGTDQVSYGDLMREYARQRGLRIWMLPVPFLTPWLSSLWLGLVTPVYARVGRALIDSMVHPSVVRDPAAQAAFSVRPIGASAAIAAALRHEDLEFAETRWNDALVAAGATTDWGGRRFNQRLVDSRVARVNVAPAKAFAPIRRIGGATGWYYGTWLWRLRGAIDLLVGGVGLRRGRRDPEEVSPGDVVDFWRVEDYEPDRRLRLHAEMKLPGRAWLEFEVQADDEGGSTIRQTATFDPLGLFGLAYWYGIWPLHRAVFRGMLRNIAAAAERDR